MPTSEPRRPFIGAEARGRVSAHEFRVLKTAETERGSAEPTRYHLNQSCGKRQKATRADFRRGSRYVGC